MEGATILVKDSNRATLSGAPGDVLIVSSVGMIKKAVQLRNQSFIIITLSFSLNRLDEVMVIGYGTAHRKDVTGAVEKIKANEFNAGIITNPLQQVQGKVAGLVVIQPGGDPNGDFIVRLRGVYPHRLKDN